MNINNIIECIGEYLTAKNYKVETDPYSDFSYLKINSNDLFLIIEDGEAAYEQSVNGLPVKTRCRIVITIVKPFNRRKERYLAGKIEMEDKGIDLIKLLCGDAVNNGIDDYRFKILPISSSHSEMQIDSQYCLARIIEIDILTQFN